MSKDPNSGYRILRFLSRASVLLNIPGCHSDAQPLSRQWRPFSFYFFIAKKIVCNHEEEPHQQRNTKPTFSASPVETERAHEHVRGRSRKRRRSESSDLTVLPFPRCLRVNGMERDTKQAVYLERCLSSVWVVGMKVADLHCLSDLVFASVISCWNDNLIEIKL